MQSDVVSQIIAAYDRCAGQLTASYEALSAADVHVGTRDLLPGQGGLILDVGAGSGRDAAWLASLGHEVVAVEPSSEMRRRAAERHPDPKIRWVDDRLPDLSSVHRLGLSYDAILLSAVWMHVPPPQRARAFRKLITLLKPGGTLLMSLRQGTPDPERTMWNAPVGEIEALARSHGLLVLKISAADDRMGRADVRWTSVCLRLPDDGAGALPLLRGVILNDDKSATYKLGLLRAIAKLADRTPGLARDLPDEDAVELPLGMIALNWIRMYLPLVSGGLPQSPGDNGETGLGFAGQGFRSLTGLGLVAMDFRIGASFSGDRARAVNAALGEAKGTIARMPATYIRYPNADARVFTAVPGRIPRVAEVLRLDAAYLWQLGALRVPGHIWRALQRLGAWVEPVLVSEWARLIRSYGERQGRTIAPGAAETALAWSDPERSTGLARDALRRVIATGQPVRCVWSGAKLRESRADIDHCLPWSAWPCGDLWNLLPSAPQVNRDQKRDRLPSAAALAASRDLILDWWETAWLQDAALGRKFQEEAAASLPLPVDARAADIFTGLEWRRLRLRQDQQVEEWAHPLCRS